MFIYAFGTESEHITKELPALKAGLYSVVDTDSTSARPSGNGKSVPRRFCTKFLSFSGSAVGLLISSAPAFLTYCPNARASSVLAHLTRSNKVYRRARSWCLLSLMSVLKPRDKIVFTCFCMRLLSTSSISSFLATDNMGER